MLPVEHRPNHLHTLSSKTFEYITAGLPEMPLALPENRNLLDKVIAGLYIDFSDVSLLQDIWKNYCRSLMNSYDGCYRQESSEYGAILIKTEKRNIQSFMKNFYRW